MKDRVALQMILDAKKDGEFKGYVIPSSNMELAKNLSTSKHHVAIYKTSEAAGGEKYLSLPLFNE